MKKLITAIFLLLSITVFAQEKESRRADISEDEMATLRAKRLAMQLDLNVEQQEKLKLFFAKRMESNKELRQERQKMREERMEMTEKQKAELREILTEEQYLKWEQLQEKRRKGRQPPKN
ncbi:hypothetical protein [Christiangramia sediminis]|uniref:DUF4890 domain-containing protein n=1 Tax=Christiangramia sediminis TaxID=2881336 RepID=A0A9X1RY86_9FLAO|nr:hypothetical protein [Christiangramia sediminis]MCB7481489.1 hypothetical protein [Christiangramia sediminis]